MPLYEYECKSCGTRFEKMQPVTAPPVEECVECGGPVRRVFHPVGIIFKGSGWYKTDSRKSNSAADTSTSTGKSTSTDGGDKAEPAATKPEPAADSTVTTSD